MIAVFSIILALVLGTTALQATIPIDGPRVVCEGSSVTLSAPSGMVNYLWTNGSTSRSITVFAAGHYMCRVTTPAGNIDSGSVDLKVGFRPRPKIGNAIEYLCEGDEANLEAPTYFVKYQWSTGDTTSSIRVTKSGTYWITVTDTNGCSGQSDKVNVQVVPKPDVHINGPDAVCPGHPTPYFVTQAPGTTYQWFCDGGTVTSGQSTNTIQVQWNRSGTIRLRASYMRPDGGLCTADTIISVNVSTKLRPQLHYNRNGICTGETIILEAAEGYRSYRWSTGETTQYIKVSKGGYYWVEVTDASGCTGVTDTLTVLDYPVPQTSITGPTVICKGADVTLQAQSADNDVVLWEWSTGQRGSQIQASTAGQYSVIGWTLDGCKDTAYHTVRVASDIVVNIPDYNLGTVPTGIQTGALITVTNNSTVDVSVMSIASSLPVTITPSVPRFIAANRSQVFSLRYTPMLPGPFYIELTWVIQSADCLDTITSVVQGVATGDPPIGSVTIDIPDTTVSMGSEVQLPVRVSWSIISADTTSVAFTVVFPARQFYLTGVSGGRMNTNTVVGDDRQIELVLNAIPNGSGERTVYLHGLPLLTSPFVIPFEPTNGRLLNGQLAIFTYDPGTVTATGCWLPGRLITLGDTPQVISAYSINGSLLLQKSIVGTNALEAALAELHAYDAQQLVLLTLTDSNGRLVYSAPYFTNNISR